MFRELIEQGYSIISSDYRGSTGYGRGFYEDIDYGGREVDDVYIGMQWMLENHSFPRSPNASASSAGAMAD